MDRGKQTKPRNEGLEGVLFVGELAPDGAPYGFKATWT